MLSNGEEGAVDVEDGFAVIVPRLGATVLVVSASKILEAVGTSAFLDSKISLVSISGDDTAGGGA